MPSTTQVKTRAQASKSVSFGSEVCLFCEKPDQCDRRKPQLNNRLHAAASREVSSQYVDDFTSKMRQMAAKLEDSRILSLLDTDVRSAELYYHLSCYNLFVKR